jgi:hypothetical protein
MSADTYQHPGNNPILDGDYVAQVMIPEWGVVAQIPTDFWPNTPGISHISGVFHNPPPHPHSASPPAWG